MRQSSHLIAPVLRCSSKRSASSFLPFRLPFLVLCSWPVALIYQSMCFVPDKGLRVHVFRVRLTNSESQAAF